MKLKASILALIFIASVFLIIPTVFSITGRIEPGGVVLRPEVKAGESKVIDRTLKVINDNDETVNVTIEPDNDLIGIAQVTDSKFQMLANEEYEAHYYLAIADPY